MGFLYSVPSITGGLSLIAFVVAAISLAYRYRLKQRRALILTARPEDRLRVIQAEAEFFQIDTTNLGNAAKEQIILQQLRIRAERERMIFIFSIIVAFLLGIIALLHPTLSTPNPEPKPTPIPTTPPSPAVTSASPTPTVFTPSNVSREGTMHDITITITPDGHGGGAFNIEFKWSGATWSGNQTATFTFKGPNNSSLQSVVVGINRSGCFYGGGNLQTQGGQLTVNPILITAVSVSLSEVHNRTEGGC